jgi:hypothetical protein
MDIITATLLGALITAIASLAPLAVYSWWTKKTINEMKKQRELTANQLDAQIAPVLDVYLAGKIEPLIAGAIPRNRNPFDIVVKNVGNGRARSLYVEVANSAGEKIMTQSIPVLAPDDEARYPIYFKDTVLPGKWKVKITGTKDILNRPREDVEKEVSWPDGK